MRTKIVLWACLIILGLPLSAWTESGPSSMAGDAVKIAEARKANAALMHQYTWNCRTEIISKGEVKDIRIDLVNYDPYGQLQRTLLNDQGSPLPRGFLRRAIAEDKKKEMEEYLTGLRGLLEQYTLPTTGKILDFISSATVGGPDVNGLLTLTGRNVVQPGDSLTLWVNPWTRHLGQMQVSTGFQGSAVQLTATFATLAVSGLNYASFAEATVPDKQLSVQIQNFDYHRPN
jgi:hypothetical protein